MIRFANRYHRCLRISSRWQSFVRYKSYDVKFGNVVIKCESQSKHGYLVPKSPLEHVNIMNSREMEQHMRWVVQKIQLGQDVMLLGLPGPLRRRIVMALAELCNWEIEYLSITKDTTESDLKQRREIVGGSAVFVDQPPVRAALHGRILILDGLENAERNVLPTINNLLENREMSLDDGRFMLPRPSVNDAITGSTKHLAFVDPRFRVVALGLSVPPYAGRSLDPPLRSRFQSRFVDEVTVESLLSTTAVAGIDSEKVQTVVNFSESLRELRSTIVRDNGSLVGLPVFSYDAFQHTLNLLRTFPRLSVQEAISHCVPAVSWMKDCVPDRHLIGVTQALASETSAKYEIDAVAQNDKGAEIVFKAQSSSLFSGSSVVTLPVTTGSDSPTTSLTSALLPFQRSALSSMLMDHALGKHVCLLGPKGCGKSAIAREFSRLLNYPHIVFPLYQELTSRDLLQRRITDVHGNTAWTDSPLVQAAREGAVCVLDGIDRLDIHALCSLRRLLQDGALDLPNGERLSLFPEASTDGKGIHPSFRVLALGLPPATGQKAVDTRLRYISSDLGWTYHTLPQASSADIRSLLTQVTSSDNEYKRAAVEKLSRALQALEEVAGGEHPELQPSFRHALNISSTLIADCMKHDLSDVELRHALENAFLIRYIHGEASELFEVAMNKIGLHKTIIRHNYGENMEAIEISVSDNLLRIGDVESVRRVAADYGKVPRPLFYENNAQSTVLRDILRSYNSETSIASLIIGNQGVGKNKLADRLLQLLNCEREYIQLHRDTTVQSLTVLPKLEDGKIYYEDSPLVRAAKHGRVLVVDEADKAPVEVLCLLKMLTEDRELVLFDGRKLVSKDKIPTKNPPKNLIPIHPQFKLFVLANRPGYPFHGNNLFRECGDVFSIHVIENLDLASEVKLLQSYGRDIDESIIHRIALAFQDLREAYERQELGYPYSAREAVSVVKHLQAFPMDGVAAAIENILGFESFNPRVRQQIAQIFQGRGIPVPVEGNIQIDFSKAVKISPSVALPDPTIIPLKLAEKTDVPVVSLPFRYAAWHKSTAVTDSFTVESARLMSFSEEIGRISLNLGNRRLVRGSIMGMVADDAGALHVLTSGPLELHSFYPGKKQRSILEGMGTYVRHDILGESLPWNMHEPSALLSEVYAPNSGVIVHIPKMNASLYMESSPEGTFKVISSSLQDQGSTQRHGFRNIFENLKSYTESALGEKAPQNKEFEAPSAIYRRGENALYLYYLIDKITKKIDFPDVALENVVQVVASSNSVTYLACGKNNDKNVVSCMITVPDKGDLATIQWIDAADAASVLIAEHSRAYGGYSAGWERVLPAKSQTVGFGGSAQHIAAVMPLSTAELRIFERDKPLNRAIEVVSTIYPCSSMSFNNLATFQKRENSREKDVSQLLEIVDIANNTKKDVSLSHEYGGDHNTTASTIAMCGLNVQEGRSTVAALLQSDGTIRFVETDHYSLQTALQGWKSMIGESQDLSSTPRFGVDSPKHGKIDPNNAPHVGGNTWAGGSGGSDTAGLGGRGGPYRLDSGNPVHQVSEADKQISAKAKAAARKMAQEAFAQKLRDIKMGKDEFAIYESMKERIEIQSAQLRLILDELTTRSQERVWLKHQTFGELDDSKLVDGLTGERMVFKRRGVADKITEFHDDSNPEGVIKKKLHFVMDVSGSMYRFNGVDNRLQRMLEAALLLMNAMPNNSDDKGTSSNISYCITGHSGDSPTIPFLSYDKKPSNEKEKMQILQEMVAHSQYCMSGDHTLEAAEAAIRAIAKPDDNGSKHESFVFVLSDANFERYGISKNRIKAVMNKDPKVQVHLILVATLGDEAERLAEYLPSGRVHLCYESTNLPLIFKNILTSYGSALDTL